MPGEDHSLTRNLGWITATGEAVAYLDGETSPDRAWLTYLAAALADPETGAARGPVLSWERSQATGRRRRTKRTTGKASADGNRPGSASMCNLAVWRDLLFEVGGFEPAEFSIDADRDLTEKLRNRGWRVGFHPAATVWSPRRLHHALS